MGIFLLLIVALAAVGALLVGGVLLFFYFRTGRDDVYYDDAPPTYGSLVQCPACGTMNPADAAACLSCRRPLPHAPRYAPPPVQRQAAPPMAPPNPNGRPMPQPVPGSYAPPVAAPRPNPPAGGAALAAALAPPMPPLSRNRPPDMPLAWLEGTGGAATGHRDMLKHADTLVGRSTSCDVQVYDPKVSRRHFLIRFANGQFFLQDQQSSRGTKINGERVMAQRIEDGDRIAIGDSSMVFRVDRSGQ